MQKKVLLLMALFVGMGIIGVASPKKSGPQQDVLVFSTTAFSDPIYGSAYVPTIITVSGGTGPYTFTVTTGSVPPGMALSSDGILSGTPTAAGSFTFTVTAQDAVSPPGQSTGTQNYTVTVDKVNLLITVNDASKVYGAALPAFSASYTGFIPGDDASKLTAQPTFATAATAGSPIATYPITASNAASNNYNISYNPGTLNVTAATLIATADNKSMFVGGPLPAFTVSYSGFVNGDGPGVVTTPSTATTTATAASPAGNYPITPAGGVAANYSFAYVNGTLAVSAKPTLTITADPATSVYGAPLVAPGALTVTYSGFVNGDGPGSLTTPPTVANSAVATSPVATYVLTPSGATSPNYNIVFVNGNYTITKAALTIKANDASKVYGAALPAFGFTYTGFVNGDDATKLGNPATASTTATTASPVGPYPITPAGATSNNYTITFNAGTLTVTAATLTATADNKSMFVGGPLPAFTVSYSGFVNGDGPGVVTTPSTATTTATAASPAGNYPITPAGGVAANYSFAYVNGTLAVSAKPTLTITADPATSVYGAPLVAPGALTVTYSGFVNGDGPGSLTTPPTVSNSAVAGSPAGPYVLTPGGASSPTYNIVYVTGGYTISKAALTIKANDASKVYGAALPAFGFTYTGFVNGDDATKLGNPATASTTATAASPVGPYPITPAGATSNNYTITFNSGTLTVTAATLTATADNKSMFVGGPLPAFTVSYSGFVNGDGPGVVTTPSTATTTATAASPAGNYPITPAGGVAANYSFAYVNGTLAVSVKPTLTITADPATSVYGAPLVAPGALTVTYSGFVNGDGPGSLTTPPTVANSAVATSPVATYVLTPSGATSPNYNIVFVNGNYTITKAALTIKANDASKVYGAALPAFGFTYTGFVNGDDATKLGNPATASTTATTASPVGPYPITAAGATSNNYTITFNPGTLTVTAATLTATADNKSMFVGGPLPAFTVSYSGFVNGDGPGVVTTPSTATTTATAASPAGNYPITPAGGVAANYSFAYVNGTLAVSAKPTLTITADPATSVYGAPLVAPGALTVTYSGFVNGDGPGSLTTPPTVSNSAVAGSPAGPYVLTPGGASSPTYNIVYVTGGYTISKAALTIKANDASKVYGAALPAFGFTYTGFVNGDDATKLGNPATASTTATAASPVGPYPITPAGATSNNYTITFNPGTLTVTAATLTVTANNQTMPLGGPLPALTVSYAGFVNGDGVANLGTAPTATTTATAASPAGNYPITPAGGAATNYIFIYVNGQLSVGKATLTITANPATSVYGAPLVAPGSLTVTYSGFVNGDGPGNLGMQPTVANSAVATSLAGTYVLTPSGAVSTNYNFVYVTGIYTITKAALTVKANDATMTYGGAVPLPLTITYTGFVNGDDATKLTTSATATTTATPTSPVGTYLITPAGAASNNYTFTYQTGTMTVGKATLTVTADNQTMPLGGPLPALTVSYTGFVNGEGTGVLTAAATATTTATAASPAGAYVITPAGAAANNYSFNYVNGTLSVGKALLTITANPATSVYGAPLVTGGSLTVTYSGFVNGDGPGSLATPPTVTNSAVATSPVGTYVLTPGGATSPNYNIVFVNGNYTITKAALTIKANDATMTYGGALPGLSASYTGFVNGDDATRLTTPPNLTTTATSSSPVGSYPITAAGAVSNNYDITYLGGTMTVNSATLTVTANNQNMPLGGPVPALTISYTGFVNGDGIANLTTAPTATTTAIATSPVGNYPITPAGGSATNYSFNYVNGTLSVGRATLTITANPAGSVYGAALVPNGSLTVSYSGFVNGDGPGSLTTLPTVTNAAFAGAPAGGYALTPGGAASANYNFNYVNGVYTISQATLNITPNSQTMAYGDAVPTLTAAYSGFVNGDNPGSLTNPPALSTTATPASPAGTYPITATGATAPNYTITYSPGVLTVGKAALTITADSKSMPLGGPLPTLTISYSGFVNGDNASNLTTLPAISTPATSASPAGAYPITVSGAASNNYTISYVTGILAVGKALLTITANPATSVYGAALIPNGSLTVSYTGFVNGDGPGSLISQPTVANAAVPGSPVGNYALVPSGAQSNNYVINYVNGSYRITAAPLTITAANKTMTYGGTVPPLTAIYSGFVNGDDASKLTTAPTITTPASSTSAVGAYPINVSSGVDANYTITYSAGILTIGKATLTVTPNSATMPYGGPLPAFTATYTGFVAGDNTADLTTQPTIATTATTSSPVGTYPITASGGASPNYNFVYNPGTLTIGAGSLQVTANAQTKEYGAADPVLTYTVTGFANGDNNSVFTGSLSRAPGEALGMYAINQGTLSAGNKYTITFTGNFLTIAIGTQHITWNQSLVIGCSEQTQIELKATASSGLPVTYTVSDPTVATVSGNILTIVKAGSAVVTATQPGDANHVAAAPVKDTILYEPGSLIRQKWSDVIFFDNTAGYYESWQWYKDGTAVPGATDPYYSETPSLNGQYYVIAKDQAGTKVQSCTLTIPPGAAIPGGIKVFPNPAAAGAKVTVTSNYSGTALQGAIMTVVDLSGRVRQQLTNIQPSMQVTMPSETGTYIIALQLASGPRATVNVLVVQ